MAMEAGQSSLTAAMALRDSFGDRKIPGISRKITSCVACRKQKIKCHMNDSKPPCTRCRKRGLSCTVNKSLQMLLENDVSWKDSMERRMRRMENVMGNVANGSSLEEFTLNESQLQSLQNSSKSAEVQDQGSASTTQAFDQPQQPWEVVIDPSSGPGGIPASCVSKVSNSASILPQAQTVSRCSDIVSQGIISLATAEKYFDLYYQRLDPVVYSILAGHDSLASIRAKSALLVAVVCAVSALQSASPDYQICYEAFRNEFAIQMLSKDHSFDDVRALCIGAFWLSDLSWNLVGAAVRIASEINLHRCITKIPHVKRDCYLRTRLYFLVYVCDHHFSVAYGRPPMTREFDLLTSPTAFLDSAFATEEDSRLISQVEIWSINGRIFDTFGVDPEMAVSDRLLPQLRRLSIALDTWRADWNDRLGRNEYVGNYPKNGDALHFYFAKLYLCSHVFRGPQPESEAYQLSSEMEEYANLAVYSASSIVRLIVVDQEMQSFLSDLPTYFETMIAFAVVFLLKVTRKSQSNIKTDREEILSLIEQLATVLTNVSAGMHGQHLLYSIATSIGRLLLTTRQSLTFPNKSQSTSAEPNRAAGSTSDQNWLMASSESMFLGNYDFFWPQDIDLDFDFSDPNFMPPPI